jgi:hypothetical protein
MKQALLQGLLIEDNQRESLPIIFYFENIFAPYISQKIVAYAVPTTNQQRIPNAEPKTVVSAKNYGR